MTIKEILFGIFFLIFGAIVVQSCKEVALQVVNADGTKTEVVEVVENKNMARFVQMTGYTKKHGEMTASMTKVKPGIIAVSRDLFDQGYVFGKKVYIHGLGIYTIADLMNSRFYNRIDVFLGGEKEAKEFGINDVKISLLEM